MIRFETKSYSKINFTIFGPSFGTRDISSCKYMYIVFDEESDVQVKNKQFHRPEAKKYEKAPWNTCALIL